MIKKFCILLYLLVNVTILLSLVKIHKNSVIQVHLASNMCNLGEL